LRLIKKKDNKNISFMKRRVLICLFLLTGLFGMAQKPVIKFVAESHDFGVIKEEDGKVSHLFTFTNVGTTDLLIIDVKPTCGCTISKFNKKPIPPGGTGTVLVTYNPKTRPGPFNKTIIVTTNCEQNKINLIIKGEVIPKPNKKAKKQEDNNNP
jgi:hypothetical protein